MSFQDKVAIVTGASSGIGRAVAVALGAGGCRTVCAARSATDLAATVEAVEAAGGTALAVQTDVTDEVQVQNLVDTTVARFGRLDLAYNNAGVPGHGSITSITVEEFDRVVAVNLRGVFLCMRYEVEAMLKSGGGAIVNCSSAAGHRGVPNKSSYAASKWAVVGLSKSAALDYAGDNIRINVVSPGAVMTPLLNRVQGEQALLAIQRATPLGRIAGPEECAQAVLYLLSDSASYVTGAVLNFDGGVSAGFSADGGRRTH